MIQTAIQAILPKLQQLDFVGNVSGLVVPITKQTVICDNEGRETIVSDTFPVACSMTADDCFKNGKYELLLPDSRRNSIFFFEELSGAKLVDTGVKGNTLKFTASVRLLGWLNLQKLGIDDCGKSGYFSIKTLCAIRGKCDLPSPFTNSWVNFELIKTVVKSPSIFSKYTFSKNKLAVFMFPYDYFALDFKVTICVNKNCLDEITIGNPIECLVV